MDEPRTFEEMVSARLAELPQYVKDAIASANPSGKLALIAQRNKLPLDQAGILEQEVFLAMLGLTDPNELAATLVSEGHYDPAVAQKIAGEVSTELFLSIRDAMRRFTDEDAAKEAPAVTPQVPDTRSPAEQQGIVRIQPGVQGVAEGRIERAVGPGTPAQPALETVMTKKETVVDVGMGAPKKNEYRTDPYRELPE